MSFTLDYDTERRLHVVCDAPVHGKNPPKASFTGRSVRGVFDAMEIDGWMTDTTGTKAAFCPACVIASKIAIAKPRPQ